MPHVIVIGAGITGVTSAYELSQLGYQVTVIDRHLYPAMETSFANGGQLSACNAEVWNQKATVIKGFKWMRQKDAPLLLNPSFDTLNSFKDSSIVLKKYFFIKSSPLNKKFYNCFSHFY